MSTLRVNTIQDSTGSSSPAINGLARAWVNFNGTGTVAIRASLNVSSITDVGTGDYRVNLTTALTDANYSVVSSGLNFGVAYSFISAGATSSSQAAIASFNNAAAGTAADVNNIQVAFFR